MISEKQAAEVAAARKLCNRCSLCGGSVDAYYPEGDGRFLFICSSIGCARPFVRNESIHDCVMEWNLLMETIENEQESARKCEVVEETWGFSATDRLVAESLQDSEGMDREEGYFRNFEEEK